MTGTSSIAIPTFSLPLDLIFQIGFLVLLAGYIVFSVILHYHWRQYSTSAAMTTTTFILYAVTTLPLIILLGLLALGSLASAS